MNKHKTLVIIFFAFFAGCSPPAEQGDLPSSSDGADSLVLDGKGYASRPRLRRDGRLAGLPRMADVYQPVFLDTIDLPIIDAKFVDALEQTDVLQRGREVRYSARFKKEGTNVNFVEPATDGIAVATYERGVEDETLSCGTGVTASAIAYYLRQPGEGPQAIPIQTQGGRLEVRFTPHSDGFTDVWLCGPAQLVFEGVVEV